MNKFNTHKKQQIRLAKHIPHSFKLSPIQSRVDRGRKIKYKDSVLKHFLWIKNLT